MLSAIAIFPQSKDVQKADVRAQRAAQILTTFTTVLGRESIPAKLLKRAKAVAVVDIELTDGLLDKEIRGHGLLSFNEPAGLSVPTFVSCKGARMEWGRSIFRPKTHVSAVFLFMDDRSFALIHGWLNKADEVTGKRLALGPIVGGKGAEAVESNASVIYYSFEGEKLSGEEFPNSKFGSTIGFSHENGLNRNIFGTNFEQLRSSPSDPAMMPQSIKAVQTLLNITFPRDAK